LIWKGAPPFHDWKRPKKPTGPGVSKEAPGRGCPFSCGLCPEHRQRTCTVLVEVTQRCNLRCPVCYADSGQAAGSDEAFESLSGRIHRAREKAGNCNIQLSGGEPTVREDLPELVSECRAAGFSFIQVNTNGIRLGREPGYARALKEAGLSSVFLQFDGTRDGVYRQLRGQPLMREKLAAIAACGSAGIGVVLVPTLVPGVNTDQVGVILETGISHAPTVRGVHFQPMSYFGRYKGQGPTDESRLTLPQLMGQLERQSGGKIQVSHFKPPGCENPRCSFHATYVIAGDASLIPLSGGPCCGEPQTAETGAKQAISHVARQWAAPGIVPVQAAETACDAASGGIWRLERFIDRAATHTFSISAMAFMDAWSIDLERLRDCCIHVASPGGDLIPFCAYNLTAAEGRGLYRTQTPPPGA
jgi:tetraether lipid synthase